MAKISSADALQALSLLIPESPAIREMAAVFMSSVAWLSRLARRRRRGRPAASSPAPSSAPSTRTSRAPAARARPARCPSPGRGPARMPDAAARWRWQRRPTSPGATYASSASQSVENRGRGSPRGAISGQGLAPRSVRSVVASASVALSNAVAGLEAEGEGFEPSVDRKAHNGFRDRPVKPLRHPSEAPETVARPAARR